MEVVEGGFWQAGGIWLGKALLSVIRPAGENKLALLPTHCRPLEADTKGEGNVEKAKSRGASCQISPFFLGLFIFFKCIFSLSSYSEIVTFDKRVDS